MAMTLWAALLVVGCSNPSLLDQSSDDHVTFHTADIHITNTHFARVPTYLTHNVCKYTPPTTTPCITDTDCTATGPACTPDGTCHAGVCSYPPSPITPSDFGCACGCGGKVQCNGRCSNLGPPNLGASCGSCGGTTQCNGQCSVGTPSNFNAPCGQCGGQVRCDGSCSNSGPGNLGQSCGHCGGRIQCDGSCSIPDPSDFGASCGSCGGTKTCGGGCTNNTPLCPSGYITDPDVPGQCRSAEVDVYAQMLSIGGAFSCGLSYDKTYSVACGDGMIQSSHVIRKQEGGNGHCEGNWANNNNLNDCSVRVHFGTAWCDNFKCLIDVRAMRRIPQCGR